ncbi:MAG TPA: hypothetical protein VF992_08985 [Thermoplasmata archaeon]
MVSASRLRVEVYRDILRSIHQLRRAAQGTSASRVGQRANVPNDRIKHRLTELAARGLLDAHGSLTEKGYEYLADYTKHVEPFLRKYRLDANE